MIALQGFSDIDIVFDAISAGAYSSAWTRQRLGWKSSGPDIVADLPGMGHCEASATSGFSKAMAKIFFKATEGPIIAVVTEII